MKKSGFAFVIFLFLLASCNDGAVEVEIKVKNFGCSDNASLANKKPSFEFTLTEKKGQCMPIVFFMSIRSIIPIIENNTWDPSMFIRIVFNCMSWKPPRKQSVTTGLKADMNALNQSVRWGMSNPCNPCTYFLVSCS